MKIKKTHWDYIGFAIPLLLALLCLASATLGHQQASLPVPMPLEFIGEYSYDGESWLPLTEEADISALKGDLMLRGNLSMEMREGWRLNFYRNHIGILFKVNGELVFQSDTIEIPDLKPEFFASVCARSWDATRVPAIGVDDLVEFHLHNPHPRHKGKVPDKRFGIYRF